MTEPSAVEIVEVSPRDGLQDETTLLSTAEKVELIERSIAAGIRRIEAVSFVRPDRVPAMADAEDVLAGVVRPHGFRLAGLVLNQRGLERALAAGVDEVNVVVLATETFSQRNQGMSTAAAISMWAKVASEASSAGIPATITLAAAFGCPYEGLVDPGRIRELARTVADSGPFEIALADTIGCGVPPEVSRLVHWIGDDTGLPIRIHLHNSRNAGFANAVAALSAGAATIDASIGGIGGCPFAPGATGNIATEDLVHLLDRMGVTTGIRLDALLKTSHWLSGALGYRLPGQVAQAGPFPSGTVDVVAHS